MSDRALPRAGAVGRRPLHACLLNPSATTHPVATAREQAEATLTRWEVGAALTEDATLVVCELVANAMLHAGGATSLDLLLLDDSAVRIEVTDTSRATPTPRLPLHGQPGGHGLMIVRKLCRSWGTVPHPAGKTVWAELTADMSEGPARAGAERIPPSPGRDR